MTIKTKSTKITTRKNRIKVGKVRLDQKNRIALTPFLPDFDISGYEVTSDEFGCITLEPLTELPTRELQLLQDSKSYESVKRGIKQIGEGKVKSRGSFAKYVDEI